MKRIGIDQATQDIYECSSGSWHSVWPNSPVISQAVFFDFGTGITEFETDQGRIDLIFREDSFDPVTRIRRGRFYQSANEINRPSEESTLIHPVYGRAGSVSYPKGAGLCTRRLFIYDQLNAPTHKDIVAIGSKDSLWRILGRKLINILGNSEG